MTYLKPHFCEAGPICWPPDQRTWALIERSKGRVRGAEMRFGIMQPYFFPYLGHFALIANVDLWIVFDVTQYTPKSWISRNRILHPASGTNWINVPLKNSSISIKIHEAKILDVNAAAKSTVGKLGHYRRRAPFFKQVEALVKETFIACGSDDSARESECKGA